MNRLFWGNFDFEEQLRGASPRSARLGRLITEMAFSWLAVCDAEDQIWCPAHVEPQFVEQLSRQLQTRGAAAPPWNPNLFVSDPEQITPASELIPWGWTTAAMEFGQRNGLPVNPPSLELVNRANSREFSVPREISPGDDWRCAELLRSLGEVIARVEPVGESQSWVIKANWSHAARERILGRGRQLSTSDIAWVKQRLSRDGVVCWEPWLDRRAEFGVQWEILPGGQFHLVAVTELLVDTRGQYAGTRVSGALPHSASLSVPRSAGLFEGGGFQAQAIAETRPVIEELSQLGYSGPVGIDCMCFYDSGAQCVRLRALQDVNVRWTMGRLAAEWSRKLSGTDILWWHGARDSAPEWAQSGEWIATTPETLDGRPVSHRTWLVCLDPSDFGSSRTH